MRDWQQVTRDYVDLVFDFERSGEYLPLLTWRDDRHTMISMPSYVGSGGDIESINYLAALVSGSLAGLDMRAYRGRNWVLMATNFFSPSDGIYLDRIGDHSGRSFWYDVLPNVLCYQVASQYPNEIPASHLRGIAERFYGVCVGLGARTDPPTLPNFDHTGFDLRRIEPLDNGQRVEPEAAAGIAWIEYMAWRQFHERRFLIAADWCLRALERKPLEANPLYEVLLPYAATTAARMNAELGRTYDTQRLLNWCFEPRPAPQARPYWGVIAERWNGIDIYGLVGSATDGGGYAFAMNTFQYAGILAPLVRYDPRFAHDVGKWLLNLANAARLFYPNALDPEHQSSYAWASRYDSRSAIAYEGLRRWKRDPTYVARADYRTAIGKVVEGSFRDTHFYNDSPPRAEVLEEAPAGATIRLDHIWQFDLPRNRERFLVIAAQRVDGGHQNNAFRFSYAPRPNGPYQEAFCITNSSRPRYCKLPTRLRGKLYVRVESTNNSPGQAARDQLRVDAMAVSCGSDVGPFAQGDVLVSFVDLVKDYSVPIVLYRPSTAATDLGLYGSSHVGMLGGLVRPTNVPQILQWDLRKTDFFHASPDPAYLYYNPYRTLKTVELEVGPQSKDVYDLVSNRLLEPSVSSIVHLSIPPDTARVVVLVPAGNSPPTSR